jgi:undecaprenyl-diphosphatase
MIWAIIIGTIPAVIFGLLLQKYMETTFRSAILVALVLLIGSAVMYFAEKFSKKNKTNCVSYPHLKDNEVLDTQYHGCFFGIGIVHRLFRTQRVSGTSQLNCRGIQTPLSNKQLSIWNGIGIGFFQCLALVPGFSRSGATISGGLFFGLNREDSARFSFLLSIPIILGSGLEQLLSILKSGGFYHDWVNILSGSATAFIVGILAIGFLMKFLKKYSLNVFIWYRIVLAIIVLTILS